MDTIGQRKTQWHSAIWDKPQNGTRYCVRRWLVADRNWQYADDGRGGIATWSNPRKAEKRAKEMGARDA